MHIVPIVEYALAAMAAYLAIGLVFAALFAGRWMRRVDPQAASGTWGFRLAIVPAAAALWPLLLLRVTRIPSSSPDAERPLRPDSLRAIQAVTFALVAMLAPIIAGVSLAVRPETPPAQPSPGVDEAPSDGRGAPFGGGLPVSLMISGSRADRRVEINVEEALAWPAAALFWSSTPPEATLPREAVYLGSLWGPARLTFPLPADGGWLAVVDFADGGKIVAVRPAGDPR